MGDSSRNRGASSKRFPGARARGIGSGTSDGGASAPIPPAQRFEMKATLKLFA
ncbi:hypothetical protein [Lysobacter antibioticus]|uniref:hypothetical protein n=1 Tax=Lysobacter antibioticus TaxID=84531 RepID=UPI0003485B61|nr:hypothetical protein [Lysobacter antibioticus]